MEAEASGQSSMCGLPFQSWSRSRMLQLPYRQQQVLGRQCQQGLMQSRQVSCKLQIKAVRPPASSADLTADEQEDADEACIVCLDAPQQHCYQNVQDWPLHLLGSIMSSQPTTVPAANVT